jgi:hypothetical protein
MEVVKKEQVKFPFLYEIVSLNHDYIKELHIEEDFDSYIVLMNLYLYTCKFMKRNKIELTKNNIYTNMEKMFKDASIRSKLIHLFSIETQLKLE